jgi:hypothetical protein
MCEFNFTHVLFLKKFDILNILCYINYKNLIKSSYQERWREEPYEAQQPVNTDKVLILSEACFWKMREVILFFWKRFYFVLKEEILRNAQVFYI